MSEDKLVQSRCNRGIAEFLHIVYVDELPQVDLPLCGTLRIIDSESWRVHLRPYSPSVSEEQYVVVVINAFLWLPNFSILCEATCFWFLPVVEDPTSFFLLYFQYFLCLSKGKATFAVIAISKYSMEYLRLR